MEIEVRINDEPPVVRSFRSLGDAKRWAEGLVPLPALVRLRLLHADTEHSYKDGRWRKGESWERMMEYAASFNRRVDALAQRYGVKDGD